MKKTAQIFLMIGIITRLIFAAPLAAIGIFEYIALTEAKKKSDIGKVLLVLTLIFVSPAAGILILCMKDEHFEKKGFTVGKLIFMAIGIIVALFLLLILIYAVATYYHYTSPVEVTAEKKEIIAMLEKEYGKPRFASAWNYADYTYTDTAGNIVKGDTREGGLAGFFFDDDYFEVVGITENTLLLFEWEDNVNSIYRSDHEMKNVEKVYEFESKYHICEFLSEELVIIRPDIDEYVIYNLETGESTEDINSYLSQYESLHHKYDYTFKNQSGLHRIENKETGKTVTFSEGEMRELLCKSCPVIKSLWEAEKIRSAYVKIKGEKIYFLCKTALEDYNDEMIIAYEYSFDTGSLEYISFLDMAQLPTTMAYNPEIYFAEKD